MLRMYNVNMDEQGKTTKFTGLIGMYYILIFPLPLSCNISIASFLIQKVSMCWQYSLLRVQGLGLYVYWVNDPGK